MISSSLLHSFIVFGGAIAVLAFSIFLRKRLEKIPRKYKKRDGKSPDLLGTFFGFGLSMLGDFDRIDSTDKMGLRRNVKYEFLTFFYMPIIPVACYESFLVNRGMSHREGAETVRNIQYHFSGSQKWNFLEIIDVYLWYWSIAGILFGIIAIIESLCGNNFI